MRKEYDLSGAGRGAVVKESGKRRITILLDTEILAAFRERAASTGRGYQTLINQASSSTRRVAHDGVSCGRISQRCPVA